MAPFSARSTMSTSNCSYLNTSQTMQCLRANDDTPNLDLSTNGILAWWRHMSRLRKSNHNLLHEWCELKQCTVFHAQMVAARSQSNKTPTAAASPVFSLPERPPRPASTSRSSTATKARTKSRSRSTAKSSAARSTAKLSSARTVCSSDEQEAFSNADSVGGASASGYQSTGSAANKSVRSTASNDSRSKIPWNIEKTLLGDIEAAGGFYSFPHGEQQAFDKFLNESGHQDEFGGKLFGERGDNLWRTLCR